MNNNIYRRILVGPRRATDLGIVPPSSRWANSTMQIKEVPIEISFDTAVKNVSLTLIKAWSGGLSWDTASVLSAGHYMVALNAAGEQIGRVDFDGAVPVSEKTLAVRGIRKVLVYPVILHTAGESQVSEAVRHRASFAVDCPSPGDVILNDTGFVHAFDTLMKHSNIANPDPKMRREVAVLVYFNPTTGETMFDSYLWTLSDPCFVASDPRPPPGWVYLAKMHSHPYYEGEDASHCPGIQRGPYNPRRNGGGSPRDWDNAAGIGEYVLTPEWAFKLRSNTPEDLRPENTDMWRRGSNGCYERVPLINTGA